MSDQKYNGWNNYETWLCKLWMDNDQGLHELQNEWALEAMQESDNDKEDARGILADRLESFWDDMQEESGIPSNGFFADMINAAMRMIDWHEIAENILSDIDVYAAGWNMPGFMPENPPALFTDKDEAIEYIKEAMDNAAQEGIEGIHNAELEKLMPHVEALENVQLGQFVYFINKL